MKKNLSKQRQIRIISEGVVPVTEPKKLSRRVLTGKELRIAAIKMLKVFYIEKYYNPLDKHLNFKGECILQKASKKGYYVGNTEIDPQKYKDNDFVQGEFFEGYFEVCAASKVKYI